MRAGRWAESQMRSGPGIPSATEWGELGAHRGPWLHLNHEVSPASAAGTVGQDPGLQGWGGRGGAVASAGGWEAVTDTGHSERAPSMEEDRPWPHLQAAAGETGAGGSCFLGERMGSREARGAESGGQSESSQCVFKRVSRGAAGLARISWEDSGLCGQRLCPQIPGLPRRADAPQWVSWPLTSWSPVWNWSGTRFAPGLSQL